MDVFKSLAELSEALRESRRELALFDDISQIITSRVEVWGAYRLDQIKEMLDFDLAAVGIITKEAQYRFDPLSEKLSDTIDIGGSIPLAGTPASFAVASKDTIVIDNMEERSKLWAFRHHVAQGFFSTVVAPLIFGDSVFGALFLGSRLVNGFRSREKTIVPRFANQMAPSIATDLLMRRPAIAPQNKSGPRLTKREKEVLNILAHGGRSKDVAEKMVISLHTVKFHVGNLYTKLEVKTRGELILVATSYGFIDN